MKHLVVCLISFQLLNCAGGSVHRSGRNAEKLLDKFQQITAENCQGGAAENVVKIALNYGLWEQFTRIPIKTANEMSAYLTQNDCKVDSLSDEFYFNEVTSNIADDKRVFGSSITLRPNLHPTKRLWAPYAFWKNGYIEQIDIAEGYDYTTRGTPYWDEQSTTNYDDVSTVVTKRKLKGSEKVTNELPVAKRKDGKWSYPYFDCGGGNTWITTHTSPILCRKDQKNTFEGIAYIDINLSDKDINQCSNEDSPSKTKDAFNDIFRGTDRCQDTTKCRPKAGEGLKRGGYECVCEKGYYMPGYKTSFDGAAIEHAYKRKGDMSHFKCLPCKAGCEECSNGKSCIKPKEGMSNEMKSSEQKSNEYNSNKWYDFPSETYSGDESYGEGFSHDSYYESGK